MERLAALCSSCGFANPAEFAFCGKCGTSVESSKPVVPTAPGYASLRSYTPKHLAEKILTSRTALEGARKQVTVLSPRAAPARGKRDSDRAAILQGRGPSDVAPRPRRAAVGARSRPRRPHRTAQGRGQVHGIASLTRARGSGIQCAGYARRAQRARAIPPPGVTATPTHWKRLISRTSLAGWPPGRPSAVTIFRIATNPHTGR